MKTEKEANKKEPKRIISSLYDEGRRFGRKEGKAQALADVMKMLNEFDKGMDSGGHQVLFLLMKELKAKLQEQKK